MSFFSVADGRGEETLSTDVSLQTRIVLPNHPLKINKDIIESKSNPQPSSVSCSSFIDGKITSDLLHNMSSEASEV